MLVKDLSQSGSEAKSTLISSNSPSTSAGKTKSVTLEQISELYSEFSPRCGGRREDYFGVAYISNKFSVPPEQLLSCVAFGGTEYGIDGYHLDKKNATFYIFTFRWSEDHMSFKDPLNKLGKRGIDKIFIDITKNPDDPPMITFLKTDLFQNWKMIEKIVINFVFNGDPVNAEQSKVLSFLRETVEDKRAIIEGYFSRVDQPESLHDVVFQYVSTQRSFGHTTSSRDSIEYVIPLGQTLKIAGNQNEMMVSLLPLDSLHQMYKDLGERFFEKNIRSGLDDGSMTNDHIKKSLDRIISGEDSAENFTLYHNGITLTAQRLDSDGEQLHLIEPRVLNGAQTIKILKQFVDEHEGKSRGKKTRKSKTSPQPSPLPSIQDSLANVKVLTRVIKSSDHDFLKRVTINNNRQNPIMPWNLRANDLIQVGLEEAFAKLGIYYERRENSFKNLTDEDLEVEGVEKGVIEIRKFAQTLLAMQGQIDRISEIKEVFENEAWYSDTFKDRYLDVDPRKFVLLYKVQFRLPGVIREIRNAGGTRYGYVSSKARNLLWCLSLQGLLNDPKFPKFVEYYGNSTSIEAGITEFLKTMATSKLRHILNDTFEDRKFQNNITEGKVSFLGSKTALNNCMETAKARFGWERLYL
jgi:hypothetical protein